MHDDGMGEPPVMDPFQECQEQMRNFEINDRPPSFRHSRAFRNFKNPPQPHMCIRDMTAEGDLEVLINVMSWTRIVKPQTPNDPIPLYGGMRVLGSSSSNSRLQGSPPAVSQKELMQPQAMLFAVMANPEVLKKASRNSVDDQDLNALVELMCEFVEAMNPGLKLRRQPVVLKDRDLSGELKNIWGAVQAKRETEREQFMISTGKHNPNLVVYTELGPDSAPNAMMVPNQQFAGENGHHNGPGEDSGGFPLNALNGGATNGNPVTSEQEKVDEGGGEDKDNNKSSNSNSESLANDHSSPAVSENKQSIAVACNNRNGSDNIKDTNPNGLDENDHHHHQQQQQQHTEQHANVPHESKLAQDDNDDNVESVSKTKSAAAVTTSMKTESHSATTEIVHQERGVDIGPIAPIPTIASKINGGKAEKEVANVKEKKEKSISGFLQNGLFGKRNKDKDASGGGGGGTKKEGKVKLGSFKSKLLLSSRSSEKEDKGTDAANAKKAAAAAVSSAPGGGGAGAGETKNSQFSEIGQSMTTAK